MNMNCPFCGSIAITYTDLSMRPVPRQIFTVNLDPACAVRVFACLCGNCMKMFFVREDDIMEDAYVAIGYRDGWCGHIHPTRNDAEACRARHSLVQRSNNTYSDRSVIIVCNCEKFKDVPIVVKGEDNFDRCGYCQKRII